jgi:hypothetical protein
MGIETTTMTKGGYIFEFSPDIATIECNAVIQGVNCHLFSLDMLDAIGDGPVPADRLARHCVDRMPWCMFLMNGPIRTVELDIEGEEDADRDMIALKAIVRYKELGYGGGIPW